jgi:predicted transcriptional regulator
MNKTLDEPMYPRRTHWERRRDVAKVLTERPEISDRRVARIAVVSQELVRQVRREMIRKSLIQSCHALRRVGADGKTYELPRAKARAEA